MVTFTKKDLEFLKLYQICQDTNSFHGSKLTLIADVKSQEICFVLITDIIKIIKKFKMRVSSDFSLTIKLSQFTAMLTHCWDTDTICINNNVIKFGGKSEYVFESFDFNKENLQYLKKVAETPDKIIVLKDLQKMEKISFSIGQDVKINCIGFQDNHFLTYDSSILSYIKTNNDIDMNFFLPEVFWKIYKIFKSDEVSLQMFKNNFIFEIEGITIYITQGQYRIPYIFEDVVQEKFNHTTEIKLNKDEFKTALSRLQVLNQENSYRRFFTYFDEDEIRLEIKDGCSGFEVLSVSGMDKTLIGTYFISNTQELLKILSILKSDVVSLWVSAKDDMKTIKIVEDDCVYILQLYTKYKEE
jgi:hypothetical protein